MRVMCGACMLDISCSWAKVRAFPFLAIPCGAMAHQNFVVDLVVEFAADVPSRQPHYAM